MTELPPHDSAALPPTRRVQGRPRIARPRALRGGPERQRPDEHASDTQSPESAASARTAALVEWHTMTGPERGAAWADLRAWVTWLHDRYELGIEQRLPRCWAQHPGLIEELWALKAWRDEIYTASQPTGQAARYWHAELRNLVHAAGTFYAAGCRAGHRGATTTAADDPELQQRWADADAMAGIPVGMWTGSTPADTALTISDTTMKDALAEQLARPLSTSIPEYVHYDGSWWVTDGQHSWVRVTEEAFATKLDASKAAMAEAAAAAQRRASVEAILRGDDHADEHEPRN
ncbi:MAG TPA: hypothetical protein VGS97_27770 [Actinocrinis sp.]|uniref:hypothetical protein n=1 Tax=Actinocrinis sp. TaxID=1920516 RepID=UPI002DDD6EB7|nr:hypothetical protein [Actinocrinis sp.]HEV2347917.1 hypothetical protein [Actinocrinis sp.]